MPPRTTIQTSYTVPILIEAVRRALGGDKIDTELPDDAFWGTGYSAASPTPTLGLDGLIAQAVVWYSRYIPELRYHMLMLNGSKIYTIPQPYYGYGIVEVFYPREKTILSMGGFSDPYLIWSGTYLRDISDVELALQYYGTAQRLFGSEKVWEFDIDDSVNPSVGKLMISPDAQPRVNNIVYRYAIWRALETLPFTDLDLILRYCTGMARERIGLARRKYGKVPGDNEGQDMDGSDLVTEGRDDQEKAAQSLRDRHGDLVAPEVA